MRNNHFWLILTDCSRLLVLWGSFCACVSSSWHFDLCGLHLVHWQLLAMLVQLGLRHACACIRCKVLLVQALEVLRSAYQLLLIHLLRLLLLLVLFWNELGIFLWLLVHISWWVTSKLGASKCHTTVFLGRHWHYPLLKPLYIKQKSLIFFS